MVKLFCAKITFEFLKRIAGEKEKIWKWETYPHNFGVQHKYITKPKTNFSFFKTMSLKIYILNYSYHAELRNYNVYVENITFCIPSANNTFYYILLLFDVTDHAYLEYWTTTTSHAQIKLHVSSGSRPSKQTRWATASN